ncbi:MAG: hypothetical protein QOK25_1553 [Thermoleophilaceae bacterium]|nr:hypothetical protein [Thermoleophilaceae bacterium]
MDVCWLAVPLTVTVTQDDCAEKPGVSRVASVEPSFSCLLLSSAARMNNVLSRPS